MVFKFNKTGMHTSSFFKQREKKKVLLRFSANRDKSKHGNENCCDVHVVQCSIYSRKKWRFEKWLLDQNDISNYRRQMLIQQQHGTAWPLPFKQCRGKKCFVFTDTLIFLKTTCLQLINQKEKGTLPKSLDKESLSACSTRNTKCFCNSTHTGKHLVRASKFTRPTKISKLLPQTSFFFPTPQDKLGSVFRNGITNSTFTCVIKYHWHHAPVSLNLTDHFITQWVIHSSQFLSFKYC